MPPVQLLGATHGYGNTAGLVQQIDPRAPHGMQLPPEHVRPVPQFVPPQQGSPLPPQLVQLPAVHAAPA